MAGNDRTRYSRRERTLSRPVLLSPTAISVPVMKRMLFFDPKFRGAASLFAASLEIFGLTSGSSTVFHLAFDLLENQIWLSNLDFVMPL